MSRAIEEYEMNRIVFSAVIGFLCRRFGIQQSKEYLESIVNNPLFWTTIQSAEKINDKMIMEKGRELFSR